MPCTVISSKLAVSVVNASNKARLWKHEILPEIELIDWEKSNNGFF